MEIITEEMDDFISAWGRRIDVRAGQPRAMSVPSYDGIQVRDFTQKVELSQRTGDAGVVQPAVVPLEDSYSITGTLAFPGIASANDLVDGGGGSITGWPFAFNLGMSAGALTCFSLPPDPVGPEVTIGNGHDGDFFINTAPTPPTRPQRFLSSSGGGFGMTITVDHDLILGWSVSIASYTIVIYDGGSPTPPPGSPTYTGGGRMTGFSATVAGTYPDGTPDANGVSMVGVVIVGS